MNLKFEGIEAHAFVKKARIKPDEIALQAVAQDVDIHPIRNERDRNRALRQMEELWGAPPGSPEAEMLEILVTLVDAYEAKHHRIDPPDPIEAIHFRMEQEGLIRADLEKLIGSRARVSEVLNRRRPLTVKMIRRLRDALGISADILIGSEPSLT